MDQVHVLTADGTPTLQLDNEYMHNMEGALSETLHVYGTAVDHVLDTGWPARFMVMGMGLGYIEFVIIAKCLSRGITPGILSFEPRRDLVEGLHAGDSLFARVQKSVEERLLFKNLKEHAHKLLSEGHWKIEGAANLQTAFRASAILYDPFSRNTSPELWSEDFLTSFLQRFADDSCVFATYASFKGLKHVLAQENFVLTKQKGFGRKRESTLAIRNSI